MEWSLALLLIVGGLLVLMVSGLPVAFCFMIISAIGAFFLWGGEAGLRQLTVSIFGSVTRFSLLPLPLFILMGAVLYRAGIGPLMIDGLDKWLGRLPGRLGLLAVGSGTIFAALSGSSLASCALLGSVLTPEMERRGYKKPMSLGPILGSGGLAIVIPPSSLAVMFGGLAEIDIGKILIGIIVPGLMMAAFYALYIIIRCTIQPSIAPIYKVPPTPLWEKIVASVRFILPGAFIVFVVTGVIFLGIATPTEAAAAGALGSFILAMIYKKLTWKVMKESVTASLKMTVMVFLILAASKGFGEILAFSGATQGLIRFTLGMAISPYIILFAMQFVLLILGMFMAVSAIMIITIPLFLPIIEALHFDLVWFTVLFLVNMEMASTTPPFGLNLFVMKSVSSPDTTMGDLYRAALPFLGCDLIVIILLIFFPVLALWLPGLMS